MKVFAETTLALIFYKEQESQHCALHSRGASVATAQFCCISKAAVGTYKQMHVTAFQQNFIYKSKCVGFGL